MTTPSSVKFTLSFNASTQQQAVEQLTSLFCGVFDTTNGTFDTLSNIQDTVNDLVLAVFHNARLSGYTEPPSPSPGDYVSNISLESLDASGKRKNATMTLSENITPLPPIQSSKENVSPPVAPATSYIPDWNPTSNHKQYREQVRKELPCLKLPSEHMRCLDEGRFHRSWDTGSAQEDGFLYYTFYFEASIDPFMVREIRYINPDRVWISNYKNVILLKNENARRFISKISKDDRYGYRLPGKDMIGKWTDAPRYRVKNMKKSSRRPSAI